MCNGCPRAYTQLPRLLEVKHFFLSGKPGSNRTPPLRTMSEESCMCTPTLRTVSEESYSPTNSNAGRPKPQQMPQQGAPGSHPWNTATGYTHTWPPASLNGQPTTARTSVPARSVKSIPLSNPDGPRRDCAAGQHTQHFGPFVPRCKSSPTHLTDAPKDIPGTCTGSRS